MQTQLVLQTRLLLTYLKKLVTHSLFLRHLKSTQITNAICHHRLVWFDNTNVSNSNSNISDFGVSDKVTTLTTFNRKPNESITIQEFVGKGVTKPLQDTQQTFERFSKLIGYKNIESDQLSFSDQPFLGSQKNQTANISMADSVEISTVKSAVELVTSQESVFIGKHYLRTQK